MALQHRIIPVRDRSSSQVSSTSQIVHAKSRPTCERARASSELRRSRLRVGRKMEDLSNEDCRCTKRKLWRTEMAISRPPAALDKDSGFSLRPFGRRRLQSGLWRAAWPVRQRRLRPHSTATARGGGVYRAGRCLCERAEAAFRWNAFRTTASARLMGARGRRAKPRH